MAAIKGKDTKPERMVRKYLFSRGLRILNNSDKTMNAKTFSEYMNYQYTSPGSGTVNSYLRAIKFLTNCQSSGYLPSETQNSL